MPSPYRAIVCVVCGKGHQTRSLTARTCSKRCSAVMRQEYAPNGRKPREYPDEIVGQIRDLYDSGMTIAEIQQEISGVKVQNVVDRYGIQTRVAAKRNQRGAANHMWRGSEAGYQALHLRVEAARGKPQECSQCGSTDGRMEWANLTGKYADVDDYARMCVSCHRNYDAARRRLTGRRASPRRG